MRGKDVQEVERRYKADERSMRQLAEEYHCSKTTIWNIVNGARHRGKKEKDGEEPNESE